jgi:hypothetical protein
MREPRVDRNVTLRWVKNAYPDRWSEATYVQFASKLLSAASEAGLISPKRDPRSLLFPKVTDTALFPPRRREAAAASIHDSLRLSQLPSELWEELKNVDSSRVGRGPDVLIILQYLQDMFDNNIRLLKFCS